jgi:hypothetical protein
MSKTFAMGAAAAVSVAAAAGAAYYVSPASETNLATPPILLDLPPEQALAKVRSITAQRYLQAVGVDADDMRLVRLDMAGGTDRAATATISFDSERVLILHAVAQPMPGGRSALDITAELPESRFTLQPNLHPYDLKVLAALADLAATDYVSSIVKRQRMASGRELERVFTARTGLDRRDGRAFGERVKLAFENAYGRQLEAMERNAALRGDWAHDDDGGDPTSSDRQYWGSDPTAEAERAAEQARYAAESAAREAERAAQEAQSSAY